MTPLFFIAKIETRIFNYDNQSLVNEVWEDVIADVKENGLPEKHVVGYLTKPCVIKMANTANITDEELDSKSEKKTEFTVNMYPWMPSQKNQQFAADWIRQWSRLLTKSIKVKRTF